MGALYHLKQKLVDFCNVIQENVSRTDTVPSSKVVYDLKADTDEEISNINSSLTVNSVSTLIDSNIAKFGDTSWHDFSQTISLENAKYIIITCGCHGCTYQSIVVPVPLLLKLPSSSSIKVAAYYDLNNQGCVSIFKNGNVAAFARTQGFTFDIEVKKAI